IKLLAPLSGACSELRSFVPASIHVCEAACADSTSLWNLRRYAAQMPPSGATQKLSFDVNDLKTSAAVSSDIVSSELASSEIVSSDIASSAALSDTSAAAVPVPASSPLHYFIKIGDIKGDSTVKGFEG